MIVKILDKIVEEKEQEVCLMDYSRKISERLWNLPDKGEIESHREEIFIDDIIQKSHCPA